MVPIVDYNPQNTTLALEKLGKAYGASVAISRTQDDLVAEFRLPYLQHTTAALLYQIWDYQETDPYNFNQYFKHYIASVTYLEAVPANLEDYTVKMHVSLAAAFNDETRFFGFVGCQPMYVKTLDALS